MSKTKKKSVKSVKANVKTTAKAAKSASKSATKSASVKSAKPKKASKAAPQKAKAAAKKAPKPASKVAKSVAKAKAPKKVEKLKGKKQAKPKAESKPKKAETASKATKTPKATKAVKPSIEEVKQKLEEAILEELAAPKAASDEEVVLTNADGLRYCKINECDELATSDTYCRYHYLLNWKKIQLRKKILVGDKLDRYIEELTSRYPDKYLEMIKKDLASEKDFLAAIQELEIDEGSNEDMDYEDDARSYIDEVRGVGVSTGGDEEEGF